MITKTDNHQYCLLRIDCAAGLRTRFADGSCYRKGSHSDGNQPNHNG